MSKNIEIKNGLVIDDKGNRCWYKDGLLHREHDKPAIEYWCGTKEWYKNGQLHRHGGLPAIVYYNGKKEYWVDGKPHTDDDLPAIMNYSGNYWYKNGELHRDNDLPALKSNYGDRECINMVKNTEKMDCLLLSMMMVVKNIGNMENKLLMKKVYVEKK